MHNINRYCTSQSLTATVTVTRTGNPWYELERRRHAPSQSLQGVSVMLPIRTQLKVKRKAALEIDFFGLFYIVTSVYTLARRLNMWVFRIPSC